MYSTTIVIVFLSVGSVVMDSNIKELCSKGYFDSYVVSNSTGPTTLRLSRKVDSNELKYHSWDLLIEYQSNGFKAKQDETQYLLKDGQTPNSSSLAQPSGCEVVIVDRSTVVETHPYHWVLNDLVVSNSVNGPTVVYTHQSIYMQCSKFKWSSGDCKDWKIVPKLEPNQRSPLSLPPTVNGSLISFSGLLCATKGNETTIYLIGGKANSMIDVNRTQFVGRLIIGKKQNDTQKNTTISDTTFLTVYVQEYNTSLEFSLELMNQTVIEFLGIDCQILESWNWFWNLFPQSKTLKKIFWSLVISGAILAITDYLLVIKRRQPKISENSDMPSDLTSSPGESTTTTTSASTSTTKTGTTSGPKKP